MSNKEWGDVVMWFGCVLMITVLGMTMYEQSKLIERVDQIESKIERAEKVLGKYGIKLGEQK